MTNAYDHDIVTLARGCWRALEPLHVVGYFAPEARQAYVALGLDARLSYFAGRSAALGAVPPAATAATFYVFAPRLVERALTGTWQVAGPDRVLQARYDGVAAALHRVLGRPDVTEALDIARRACEGLTTHGRPLYAAHSAVPWPEDDDLLALWHAATLLREHRGDGHVSVLLAAGLDPVESLVLGGLYAHNTDFLRQTRGWREEDWAAAQDRLRGRGLLTGAGELTEQGRATRAQIERDTDVLAAEGWAGVGAADCRRLVELVTPWSDQVLAADVLPDWVSRRP